MHLREEEAHPENLILPHLSQFVGTFLNIPRARFVVWTNPLTLSLPPGTLADLARHQSELVAENALLRQQLIILKRKVNMPS